MSFIFSLIQNLPLLIAGLLGLGFLVTFHEFGHFLFARLFNVHVPSFSIGFGPRLIEKKIGDTTFALSAIPLGGYVEVAGHQEVGQGEQKEAQRDDERSFNKKPYWQKLLIMFGGILFNFIFGYLALSFIYFIGAPGLVSGSEMLIGKWAFKETPVISFVPAKAAEKIPLHAKDKILSINNHEVSSIENVVNTVGLYPDQDVTFKVERNGSIVDVPVKLSSRIQKSTDKETETKIGTLSAFWYIAPLSLKDSFKEGFNTCVDLSKKVVFAIKSLFTSEGASNVGGPLMIIHQLKEGASLGIGFFLFLLSFISINLAVLNFIPLPIFDGGQILFFTIETLIGRPLSDATRYKIHYYNWLFVIALVVYLTYKDITRLTGLHNYLNRETITKLFSRSNI